MTPGAYVPGGPGRAERVGPCTCRKAWSEDLGRRDPVTGEWLPRAPVTVVSLEPDADCPRHRLWYLHDEVELVRELPEALGDWALFQFPTRTPTPYGAGVFKVWLAQVRVGRPFGPALAR